MLQIYNIFSVLFIFAYLHANFVHNLCVIFSQFALSPRQNNNMMQKAEFDATASGYDKEFTFTQTGKYQRLQVWKQVDKLFLQGKKVLEMNCGTGEDAIFLAKKGAIVTATDFSTEMLYVASQKTGNEFVTFEKWDLREDFPLSKNEKYDFAFSNFGGWNCLNTGEIILLSKRLSEILTEKAHISLVIMPSFCLWETLYFLLKGNIKNAFRRRDRKGVLARLNDFQSVMTYYYSPKTIEKILYANFVVKKVVPIGCFLPPSYLDNFFQKIPFALSILFFLEKIAAYIPFLAYFSDHYYMVLEKK